jgi:Flp pilus assembly protein TadG
VNRRRWPRLRTRLSDCRRDDGSAIIEFIFVAVVVMVPLVYVIVAVSVVQRSQLAVTQGARDIGRAFATSPSAGQAAPRSDAALRLALADQGLPDDAELRFVAADASCDAPAITPALVPGAVFTVCVSRHVRLPAVPTLLAGRGVTTVSRYVVHVDDYRAVPQ